MKASDGAEVFYIIDWSSTKQRRVRYSSYGAKILACSEADDRGLYLQQSLSELKGRNVKQILHVNSWGYSTQYLHLTSDVSTS